jgi:hypothetical protein
MVPPSGVALTEVLPARSSSERPVAAAPAPSPVAAWRTGHIPVVLAAVAGVAVVGLLSFGPLRTLGGLFSSEAGPAAPEAVAAAPLASEVVLDLDSRPSGAAVQLENGAVLGRTPLSLRLPRGKARAAFLIHKEGFEPLRYEVIPERDAMAMLELRALPGAPAAPAAATPPGAPAPQ